jgi:septal ring factor EnvC (AmiA/AmiB activator)
MLSILENNRKEIEGSSYTLKRLYLMSANELLKKIRKDIADVNKELRQRKIKVFEEERRSVSILYRLIYRGFEHKFQLTRDTIKTESSKRFRRYINEMFQVR